eukprot:CAMPEP_0176109174 /NCGR_PEP_ID=MMETSP0120_2-20121206/54810_1 /TAXON_ID=160619 /ORGANISM="Kryptoperidinium foliaceum, Strain CCMP 1326" /LENGTH=119 /DNA_ID=CAMNT_0017443353 /DNA_START=193 /DNA_END=549 /DNA_ORIENTATION=+
MPSMPNAKAKAAVRCAMRRCRARARLQNKCPKCAQTRRCRFQGTRLAADTPVGQTQTCDVRYAHSASSSVALLRFRLLGVGAFLVVIGAEHGRMKEGREVLQFLITDQAVAIFVGIVED